MSDESLVDDIAWVDVIYQKDATDNLKLAYEAVKGKDGTVENLYLAGSSVFPSSGWAYPTINIVKLSLKLGDHLNKL